jgi:hypothetical protein
MATLNINETHFEIRQQTLKDFVQYKDIVGIICLQDMIDSDLQFIKQDNRNVPYCGARIYITSETWNSRLRICLFVHKILPVKLWP